MWISRLGGTRKSWGTLSIEILDRNRVFSLSIHSQDCYFEFARTRRLSMPQRFEPGHLLFRIKYWALEVAATVMFLVWLFKAVWHEIGGQ